MENHIIKGKEYKIKDLYRILDVLMSDGFEDYNLDILIKDDTAFEPDCYARYSVDNYEYDYGNNSINLYCK